MKKEDKSWHESFEIPDKDSFSFNVQKAIQTGIVDSKSRREIHQTLRTLILQHTWFPEADGYNMVCRKLITKFSNLRDESKTGFEDIIIGIYNFFKFTLFLSLESLEIGNKKRYEELAKTRISQTS